MLSPNYIPFPKSSLQAKRFSELHDFPSRFFNDV